MPTVGATFDSIVVAHDLRPVGKLALELGGSLAQMDDAGLYVIHAIESPECECLLPANVAAQKASSHHEVSRKQIDEQLAQLGLLDLAEVSVTCTPPHTAILEAVNDQQADLLVIGTVGRTGVQGLITGNTAEYLLPRVSCSILAVKPPEFCLADQS